MGEVEVIATVMGLLLGGLLMLRVRAPLSAVELNREFSRDTSVIIPARNEEASLPLLLASLASQPQPPREVIVVDDGSVDATALVARRHGAFVVACGEPPAGWLAKPWACAAGVDASSGSRLVLIDADTVLSPRGLERILRSHEILAPEGLLSVQPYHEARRSYEQLSAVANLVVVLGSGMGGSRKRSARVAFGPCLVTERVTLGRAGGFAAVRGEVTEDAALARAYGSIGAPVVCLAGGDALSFRMFPNGVRQMVDGWTRTLARGAERGSALQPPTSGARTGPGTVSCVRRVPIRPRLHRAGPTHGAGLRTPLRLARSTRDTFG